MPPPVMRVSPGRELKVDNFKRRRSLESGSLFREKEDDLALFNEVRNRERDGFLLQSNDNVDDFFSTKLRCFSGYKLGAPIPARGESSDMLNAERDKNDYDWLITPPDTPLFRSLDDEARPVKVAPRGRPRSQIVSFSRSPTMDKDYRSGKGGASPQRFSPSPRSGNSTLQSKSRPFSANHLSAPPTTRHTSPVRRLSSSPSMTTYAPRSSTPTPRRISTGFIGTSALPRVRGSSPIKTSRGNSASPKIRAWQTNIPGFSLVAPPNLRTSMADRTASHVRTASPASRDSSRYGKQSMSPTASSSIASPHSHDQNGFSPSRKGSFASSGDDDADLSKSIPQGQSAPRNTVVHLSNEVMSFSRKPVKNLSSSAPKISFDLAQQMERSGPHNMFRPLLSSVPSSTFHAGKTSTHQRSLTSRNSSVTTSSSASCDQTASGAHDEEASELNQKDVTSDCVREHYPDMDDEPFVMDHGGDIEDIKNRIMHDSLGSQHRENDGTPIIVSTLDVRSGNRFDPAIVKDYPVLLDAVCAPDTMTCSECGSVFPSAELVIEGDLQLCLECRCLEVHTVQNIEHEAQEVKYQSVSTSGCLQLTCTGQTGKNNLNTQNSYSDLSQSLSVELFEEGEPTLASENVIEQPMEKLQLEVANSRLNVLECSGISLLLKRSSSIERYIVQSRSFTESTTTSYDDFSYARDSSNSVRSSIERTSESVSSSLDLGSYRQTEFRNVWQLSGHKSDSENYQYETPAKLKRSVSSMSSTSGHMFQVISATPSFHEDGFEEITGPMSKELGEETRVDPLEQSLASEIAEAESTCSDIEVNIVSKNSSKLSSCLMNDHSTLTSQEPASHENRDNLMNNSHNMPIEETSFVHPLTSNKVDGSASTSCADTVDAAEVRNPRSLNMVSENADYDDVAYYGSHSDADSTNSRSCTSELQLHDASAVRATAKEFRTSHHAHVVLEESHILLEETGRENIKILTLEEAADAILFCSSIIHNLAYEAANFAIDNETLPLEVLRPAATLVGRSNLERRDTHLMKRSFRSQKARKKSIKVETSTSSCYAETLEKSSPCRDGPCDDGAPDIGESMKPPNPESKCNCLIM